METLTPSAEVQTAPSSAQVETSKPVKAKRIRKAKPVKAPQVVLAVEHWQHATAPAMPKGTKGVKVLNVGDKTGRKDKAGNDILSKSLVVTTPNNKDLGLTGDASIAKQRAIGKEVKLAVAGRIATALAADSFIVRRYQETQGKRNSIAVRFEQFSEESAVARLARELNKPESEVRKALGMPSDTTIEV